MDDANENELKEKIIKLIDERIVIFTQYENLFSKKILPNKDLTKICIQQAQHLKNEYFEMTLKLAEENIKLFPTLLLKYKVLD